MGAQWFRFEAYLRIDGFRVEAFETRNPKSSDRRPWRDIGDGARMVRIAFCAMTD